jgi:hypothetical protein
MIYEPDGEQRGPYSVEEIQNRLARGILRSTDLAWNSDQEEWVPLSEIIFSKSPGASSSLRQNVAVSSRVVRAGWICLALGLLTFRMFGLGFLFFIASFFLSIAAMCSQQVNRGIALNISNYVASELALHILGGS